MNRYSTIQDRQVSVLNFRPVAIRDIPLLVKYFTRFPSRSCDYSVGGVMMWIDYFDYELAETDGSLLIKGRDPVSGKLIFYRPCGPMDPADFNSLVSAYLKTRNQPAEIIYAEERVPDATLGSHEDGNDCISDWMEYLYDAQHMSSFAGRKMEKKRNHLNFFINNYSPFEIEDISSKNIPELISFTLAFEMVHQDSELAQYECTQVIDVLRNYEEYPFIGIAVRKDGNIIGYSFGELINDTFFTHVEKGDTAYRGIYQFLASRMTMKALAENPSLRFVNREEDMGDESLRLSKESYHPTLLIDKKKVELQINR